MLRLSLGTEQRRAAGRRGGQKMLNCAELAKYKKAVYEMGEKKHVKFQGRLVFVGFGSVGQGTLPLLLRHIDIPRDRIVIVTGDDRGREEADHYGVKFI